MMRKLAHWACLILLANNAVADCTLTNLNTTPLPELVFYNGYPGGLYPNGLNAPPPAHLAAGVRYAETDVQPRNANGDVDQQNGKIVMTSIGMSNTGMEFSNKGPGVFKLQADADPAKNPRLILVDGSQNAQPSTEWTDQNAETWTRMVTKLNDAGVTTKMDVR